jgi:hypothetical protein
VRFFFFAILDKLLQHVFRECYGRGNLTEDLTDIDLVKLMLLREADDMVRDKLTRQCPQSNLVACIESAEQIGEGRPPIFEAKEFFILVC